jgi:hypothetical protein
MATNPKDPADPSEDPANVDRNKCVTTSLLNLSTRLKFALVVGKTMQIQ